MMNQKGFATIFALCMILVIALVAKGIQESEMNYAYEITNFQEEFELQNAADSGIYEAAEMVRLEKIIISPNGFKRNPVKIPVAQPKSDKFKSITLNVWGERGVNPDPTSSKNILHRQAKYLSSGKISYTNKGNSNGYIFFSVASRKSKQTGEKIYRRAFAYVLDGDDKTIHFMELFSGNDN